MTFRCSELAILIYISKPLMVLIKVYLMIHNRFKINLVLRSEIKTI